MSLSPDFLSYFADVEDPRVQDRNLRHKLEDMFAMAIPAVICGADNWVEISNFAESKEAWLREFLELPNGIPSHDTFGRLFALLDAQLFECCFSEWAHSLPVPMEGSIKREIIATLGKTSRASHNRRRGRRPLHPRLRGDKPAERLGLRAGIDAGAGQDSGEIQRDRSHFPIAEHDRRREPDSIGRAA